MVANPNPAVVCDSSNLGTTELSWDYPGLMDIHIDSADGPLFASVSGTGSQETPKLIEDGLEFYAVDSETGKTIQTLPVNTTVLGCIGNAPGTFRGEAGLAHTNWLDHPSREDCGSCHDHVNFETGEGHSMFNIVQPDDNKCGNCHEPDSGFEFDFSIKGAHKAVYKSVQLPGLLIDIVDVTNTNPDDKPTVTFSLATKDGPLDPAGLAFFNLTIAGPNDDFSFLARESAQGAVKDGDNWSYTFNTPLPVDADGSFTAGAEIFNMVPIIQRGEENVVRHTAENPTFEFAVTDAVAVPRRMVVDDAKCESCHSNLALHGTIRHNTQYCVSCHQPAATDINQRAEGDLEEAIHFKFMVHKIHRGEDLENGFVVAGFGGSLHDYGHVEFPGDLRNCDKCHVNGSEQLPLPAGLLPTVTPQIWWDPTLPQAAACLSCHDGDDAAAHAFTNTAIFGEACSTCHGEGMTFAVDKVHAR